ncbi:hypothetical protein B0H19DRAFT_1069237 [Mycena capillaripes]|nr:hypothetical protein B0H19DRAFT_1069237 [Mycena capillaripes]
MWLYTKFDLIDLESRQHYSRVRRQRPGTGACGHTDLVASVSTKFFQSYDDGSGNKHPICDHHIVAVNTANGKKVTARVVDDFTDPHWGEYGLGFSLAAFEALGGSGTISDVKWHVI